jgi:hypothetical protein
MGLEEDAEGVWTFFSKDPLFPSKCCKFAALEMYKRGYEIVMGIVHVQPDNKCELGGKNLHFWNYDPLSKRFVDITASQFNGYFRIPLSNIAIWTQGEAPPGYELIKRNISPYNVI